MSRSQNRLMAFVAPVVLFLGGMAMAASETHPGLYQLNATPIGGGAPRPLSEYKGKVLMVVNTASQCGFTPQYQGLEALYQKYKEKGFVILGFPSNDFGSQEPGSNQEIKKFCETKYHVTFPLFSKNPVKGAAKQPVYQYLTEKVAPANRGEIAWNFEKFVVDRNGVVVARFKSAVDPQSTQISSVLEPLLK